MTVHRTAGLLSVAFLTLLSGSAVALAAKPEINGSLEQIGPFRVLRVWGTPQEMGFAHGFLLGRRLVDGLNSQFVRRGVTPETRADFESAQERLLAAVRIPPNVREELKGILQGVEAVYGRPAELVALNRTLRLSDLVLWNAGDMTRAFQCSGFTTWGDRAGGTGVMTGRNFDYAILFPEMLNDQLILVRHPNERHQVATITWPGYLGAATGVNDTGVCTFMHDGTGPTLRTPSGRRNPVALVLKDVLERSDPQQAFADAEQALSTVAPYPFSYFSRVVTPRMPGRSDKPVRIFRIDASGLSQNPVGNGTCITTNHYLDATFAPSEGAGKWSLTRYARLKQRLGKSTTPERAWAALHSVSVSNDNSGTLHTIVVYPEKRELDLGFGRLDGTKVISATASRPTRITFEELFRPRP